MPSRHRVRYSTASYLVVDYSKHVFFSYILQMGLLCWTWDYFNHWSINVRSTKCFELYNPCDFCCSDEHCRSNATLTKTHSQLAVDQAPLLNGTRRRMSADIYEDPRQPESCPVILQTRRKCEESMRNLAGPNTSMQEGTWPYLLKMLFWEQWARVINISRPSPVLWLFRVSEPL